jgi:hypothetical protein
VIFVLHSVMFIVQPELARDELRSGPLTLPQYRLLGVAELAGGAVLIADVFADPPSGLVASAAAGLIGVAVPATILHIRAKELPQAVFTAALTVGSAVVMANALTS